MKITVINIKKISLSGFDHPSFENPSNQKTCPQSECVFHVIWNTVISSRTPSRRHHHIFKNRGDVTKNLQFNGETITSTMKFEAMIRGHWKKHLQLDHKTFVRIWWSVGRCEYMRDLWVNNNSSISGLISSQDKTKKQPSVGQVLSHWCTDTTSLRSLSNKHL